MDWSGKNVLVLGLGDTGLSMTRWLARRGARVRVADTRAQPPPARPLAAALPRASPAAGARRCACPAPRPQPPHARTLAAELPDVALAAGAFDASLFSGIDAIAI